MTNLERFCEAHKAGKAEVSCIGDEVKVEVVHEKGVEVFFITREELPEKLDPPCDVCESILKMFER